MPSCYRPFLPSPSLFAFPVYRVQIFALQEGGARKGALPRVPPRARLQVRAAQPLSGQAQQRQALRPHLHGVRRRRHPLREAQVQVLHGGAGVDREAHQAAPPDEGQVQRVQAHGVRPPHAHRGCARASPRVGGNFQILRPRF